MNIYQIADLHIGLGDISKQHKKIKVFCEYVRKRQHPNEEFVISILGDIIDGGNPDAYDNAGNIFEYIISQMKSFDFSFEFLPGNHDICNASLETFDKFIMKYQKYDWRYTQSNSFSVIHEGLNFIYTNSITHLIYNKPGKLDMYSINSCMKSGMENVLLLHHSFFEEDNGGHSDVENSATKEQDLIKSGVKFVFHSHTHAGRRYHNDTINFLGCGSLSKEIIDMENINNQFNVIRIQHNKIVNVNKLIFMGDSDNLITEPLFPKSIQHFDDPLKVVKIRYPKVESYINRNVWPHAIAVGEVWEQFLAKEKQIKLIELCLNEKRILIMSDAGMGKSCDLRQLAYELSEQNSLFYPILYFLENYDGTKIQELVPDVYRNLYSGNLIFIFDGYDELDVKLKVDFERNLRTYIEENPETQIIISSRSNFCRNVINNSISTFSDFQIYDLCKLGIDDISNYLKSNDVDVESFYNELKKNHLNDLVSNPFYMTHMTNIYKKDGRLSDKAGIMDRLLDLQLSSDDSKFACVDTSTIEELKFSIKSSMEKIAFSMQLLGKNVLKDEDEYQALFNSDIQKLAKYCGLFTKVDDSWKFIHNNFREYFSARFLNRMELKEIIEYISYDGQSIKENWVNTLSYLAAVRKDQDVLDWLVERNPNALIKFERERIEGNLRDRIFKSIFLDYEIRNIWFHDSLCDETEMALFGESLDSLLFILDKINNPVHFRSQYTALILLREFHVLFGKNSIVREALVNCCQNENTRGHECRVAITTISKLHLDNDEITELLNTHFSDSSDDYCRLGMYEYLIMTNNVDKYVDYFLSGLKYIHHNAKENRIGNESFELVDGLKQLTQKESIFKTLEFLSKTNEGELFYDADNVFEILCDKVTSLYKAEIVEDLKFLLGILGMAIEHHNRKQTRSIIMCLLNIGTIKALMDFLFISGKYDATYQFYLGDILFDNLDCLEYLSYLYQNSLLEDDEVFIRTIQRINIPEDRYEEYADIIYKKSGRQIVQSEKIDYERIRKEGTQRYFDGLFSESGCHNLLYGLIAFVGNDDITIDELLDVVIRSNNDSENEIHKLVLNSIFRFRSEDTDMQAKLFFNTMPWEIYSDIKVIEVLQQNTWLIPNVDQLLHIRSRCLDMISRIDFSDSDVFNKGKYYNMALFIAYTTKHNYVELSEDIKLNLLILPSYFFDSKGRESDKYDVLCEGISENVIKRRIEENIISGKAKQEVLNDHLEYCTEKRIYGVCENATKVCLDDQSGQWLKHTAFHYILNTFGQEFILENLLSDINDDLLLEFCNKTWQSVEYRLISEVEKRYLVNGSKHYLRYLILLNREQGLRKYIEIVSEIKSVPQDDGIVENCTEAIGFISDPSLLDLLYELVILRFSEGFVDNCFSSLLGSLSKAYLTISEVNNVATESALQVILNEHSNNHEYVYFCNNALSSIKENQARKLAISYTLKQVKRIIDQY